MRPAGISPVEPSSAVVVTGPAPTPSQRPRRTRLVVAFLVVVAVVGLVTVVRPAYAKAAALRACEDEIHAGIGSPMVSSEERRSHLESAVREADRAASADTAWTGLSEAMNRLADASAAQGSSADLLGMTPEDVRPRLEACQDAGMAP